MQVPGAQSAEKVIIEVPEESQLTATQIEATLPPPQPEHAAKTTPPTPAAVNHAPSHAEDEVTEPGDSVSEAAGNGGGASGGNPYWKLLGKQVSCFNRFSPQRLSPPSGPSPRLCPRMRRYFTPKAGGLKCSEASLKMWNDPSKRSLVAEMLVLCLA